MAKQPRSLYGKVVAITGGARGIGKATAQALVRKGAKVAIGDLDVELAQKTAAELGGDTLALELDVTRRDSFEGFLDQVEERLGSLDVLVNNAGIMPIGDFVEESDRTAQMMVDINVHGVLYGMKLALPGMQRRNSGHIVNIASQAGKAGFPGGATYCGTKHFVVGASEAVRQEVRETEHRGLLRDARGRQHRARLRAGRDPGDQEDRARGRSRRDRRRARGAEVRRLGTARERAAVPVHAADATRRPRGPRAVPEGRQGPRRSRQGAPRRLRGARRAFRAGARGERRGQPRPRRRPASR